MKTIIIATDFSATAKNAANYAADMAIAINADLFLLHIAPPPLAFGEILTTTTAEVMRKAEKEIKKQQEQLLEKVFPAKLQIYTEVRLGSFFETLNMVCEKVVPYAVILGSQGTTAIERFVFGGHAVHTMKHLPWAVITVPPGVNFSSVKKIAFACDFENTSSIPLDEIKILAKEFKSELHIVNIGRKGTWDLITNLKTFWLRIGLDPIKPKYHFIDDLDTDAAIIDFAEKNGIDLLLVLPKRPGLLNRMIYTSTSKHLILHCHVPVMTLHQQ